MARAKRRSDAVYNMRRRLKRQAARIYRQIKQTGSKIEKSGLRSAAASLMREAQSLKLRGKSQKAQNKVYSNLGANEKSYKLQYSKNISNSAFYRNMSRAFNGNGGFGSLVGGGKSGSRVFAMMFNLAYQGKIMEAGSLEALSKQEGKTLYQLAYDLSKNEEFKTAYNDALDEIRQAMDDSGHLKGSVAWITSPIIETQVARVANIMSF